MQMQRPKKYIGTKKDIAALRYVSHDGVNVRHIIKRLGYRAVVF